MSWIKRNIDKYSVLSSNKVKQKQFAWVIIIAVSLFVTIKFFSSGYQPNIYLPLLLLILFLLLIIIFKPIILKPLLFLWFFLGAFMGEISSTLILGIVYYFVFFPITFFIRAFSKKKTANWIETNNSGTNYEKMY